MKKNIRWAVIFSAVVLICLGVIFFGQLTADSKGAEIYLGGKLYKTVENIENTQPGEITVRTPEGFNRICWHNGSIWVEEADCASLTCKKYGKATLIGETIVCAPHGLVIKVVGKTDDEVDAMT